MPINLSHENIHNVNIRASAGSRTPQSPSTKTISFRSVIREFTVIVEDETGIALNQQS